MNIVVVCKQLPSVRVSKICIIKNKNLAGFVFIEVKLMSKEIIFGFIFFSYMFNDYINNFIINFEFKK